MIPRLILRMVFFMGVALALQACSNYQPAAANDALTRGNFSVDRVVQNIQFSPQGWPEKLEGDLYLPQRPGLRPVVVTIHGGSWSSRSRSDMEDISGKLVRRGYAVFNISYRFAPEHIYPAQLHDVQQSLIWLQDHATRYRLDRDRINTWGYSSGAHLAALSVQSELDGRNEISVRAVVAGGIPADLRVYHDSPIVSRFMGGRLERMADRYAEASPVYHVSADDPPDFIYHGRLDMLVEPEQAKNYYAELKAGGVAAELYMHNWLGHMTLFLLGDDAENRAIDFLDRQNRQLEASTG